MCLWVRLSSHILPYFANMHVVSFGLLHRIPPIPENREPGAVPLELMEQTEEYEDQELFVPADLTDSIETPEQREERLHWEQEEWEREQYARNYAAAVNQTSPSVYDLPSDPERTPSHHGIDSASEPSVVNLSHKATVNAPVQSPPKESPSAARGFDVSPVPVLPVKVSSRPSTPVHTPFTSPRASTPTPSRPLGYHMSSEFLCWWMVNRCLCPLGSGPRNSSSYTVMGCAHVRRWSQGCYIAAG